MSGWLRRGAELAVPLQFARHLDSFRLQHGPGNAELPWRYLTVRTDQRHGPGGVHARTVA